MLDKTIHKNILELVGNTPIVELSKIFEGYPFRVLAKLEFLNPGGSVKDRVGIGMILDAEKRGLIKPGSTVIESTSGNTGIGVALAAAVKGYKAIFTIPDKMSKEKIRLLKSLGAKVIVTPTGLPYEDPNSYYGVARRLEKEIPGALYLNQYSNLSNPEIHYQTTAPEIHEQLDGKLDYLIITMGTAGTISGCGKYFKTHLPHVKIVGIDPEGSILEHYFRTKQIIKGKVYKVEGIGEDMIPDVAFFEYIDDIIKTNDTESFKMARKLAVMEGLHAGGSSGAAIAGIMKYKDHIKEGSTVVTILSDRGERYLTKFYNDEWLLDNEFDKAHLKIKDFIDINKYANELFSISPKTNIQKTLEMFNRYNYYVLPVFDGINNAGSIQKSILLKAVIEDSLDLERPIMPYMGLPLGMVSLNDRLSSLYHLLKIYEGVILVGDDKKIFFTREDFIKNIDLGGDIFEV
jgi:cystathionine beta-synthase